MIDRNDWKGGGDGRQEMWTGQRMRNGAHRVVIVLSLSAMGYLGCEIHLKQFTDIL